MTPRKSETLRMIRRLLESILYRTEPDFRVTRTVDCGRFGLIEYDIATGDHRNVRRPGPADPKGAW